ncbi:MAG: vitamin K epoxide reductase family protein [Candidatus Nanohaloarchaeota archaeon QJJ-5]|nr:vitamin K epoxide reductase family protein [Candidatus Nanohaloarchaeota archaeon QJJ-5]
MEQDRKLKIVFGLSLIGLLIATYQTYDYYFGLAICSGDSVFSCALVTESAYGSLPPNSGIATALWGAVWWIGMLTITGISLRKPGQWLTDVFFVLFVMSLGGVVVTGYLVFVELYLLPAETGQLAICPFCTAQHILIVTIAALSYTMLEEPFTETLHVWYRSLIR